MQKPVLKFFILMTIGVLITSCSSSVRFSSDSCKRGNSVSYQAGNNDIKRGEKTIVLASYYDSKFNGRKTASGAVYDEDEFTAAHKTFPFGSKLKITNIKNKKQTIVIINDRGPFVPDRALDLSLAAAIQLDMLSAGVAEVEVEVLE